MMSSATSQRAGRAPKDKNKSQPVHITTKGKDSSEGTKTSDGIVSKIQVSVYSFNYVMRAKFALKIKF